MIYPLILDLAAKSTPIHVPVTVTCRVLGFSKQAFYVWCKNPISQRDRNDNHLIDTALDIHAADPGFGYRPPHFASTLDESRRAIDTLCCEAHTQTCADSGAKSKGERRR